MKCGCCKDDHQTAAMVQMCYKNAGKITVGAPTEQRQLPSEPGYVSARGRHHGGRRDLFAQLRELGDRVEAGSYAIRNTPGGQNDISFYEVDKPTKGKWAGKTFVKRRLSDDTARLSVPETVRVLTAIVADQQGASMLFGQKLGFCGVCGKSLTNQESRDRGIGPKCAKRMGWTDAA